MPSKPTKPEKRRPLQHRSRETVEVVLRATAQILSRDGAAALTTNQVAEVAGVSIGTLYQYFANKEALIAEVRRRYEDAFRERILGVVQRAGSMQIEEAVGHFVRVLIEIHAENPGLHNAVSTAGLEATERRLLQQVAASWLDARRDEVRRPDRVLAAAVALDTAESLIHGVALRDPARLDDAFAAEVTDMLVRYLVK